VNAHLAAVVVLASTARVPVLSKFVARLTAEPSFTAAVVGGVRAIVVEPSTKEHATIVFLNGGTRLGCVHPAVQRLSRGMGRAGCKVVAPELSGLRDGELTPATLDAVVAAVSDAASKSSTGRVTLFGVSVGASLGLLAAADSALIGRVDRVVAIAPWADLEAIVELATTGTYEGAPRTTTPLVRQFVNSSLTALCGEDEVEAALERLSPLRVAGRIRVPVELAAAADEGYFPLEEMEKLAAALPDARLTLTTLLDHVTLRPTVRGRDLVRFVRFTARSFGGRPDPKGSGRAGQPLKFLAVGSGGYAVGLFVFAELYAAGLPYAAASVAAYLFANALMYLGNRYFTFRLGHEAFWRAYARYVGVGVVIATLNALLLFGLVEVCDLGARLGQALSLLLIAPAAFVAFKRWTFKLRPSSAD
jgi:putative flippase GtrA/pimeloyl-ACP methyl ester carboxylesterase